MKIYPPGQVTKYGSTMLLERVEPLILYTTKSESIQWCIYGGLAPSPGVQEGAYLAEGMKGIHPAFSMVEHRGARQHGVTTQAVVFDPAEFDMEVEFSVPPNSSNPEIAAAAIRRVIREWIASWDPDNPGTMAWVTPDMGRWWCNPRFYRSPPQAEFAAKARRLRQRYTWTVRNDEAFWHGVDSVSEFDFDYSTGFDLFDRTDVTSLGVQWHSQYSGAGAGNVGTDGKRARWYPSGTTARSVYNRFLGLNEIHTISLDSTVTGGTWTYTKGANTTAGIAWNASASTVQTAITGLASVGSGNVTVTGPNGGPWEVTYVNSLAFTNVSASVSGALLTPGLTSNLAQLATKVDGNNGTTSTDNQVITLKIGDPHQYPPQTQSLDFWARCNTNDASPTGLRCEIGVNDVKLYRVNAGVDTLIPPRPIPVPFLSLVIPPLWNEEFKFIVGTSTNAREYKLFRKGFQIMHWVESGTGSVIGSSNRGSGWGMHAGPAGPFAGTQDVPASVDEWHVGDNVTISQSGTITLTNIGDQDGYPRYLCYGPGTFRIANGPNSTNFVEFGPLGDNQIALLTTLPRLRGVVDLSPDQPTQDLSSFQSFVETLISLATNNNVPPLLDWFESLLGILPPQGELYSLLNGRFDKPIPKKDAGVAPTPVQIPCQIVNGNAESKIVAALTPLRRWPE